MLKIFYSLTKPSCPASQIFDITKFCSPHTTFLIVDFTKCRISWTQFTCLQRQNFMVFETDSEVNSGPQNTLIWRNFSARMCSRFRWLFQSRWIVIFTDFWLCFFSRQPKSYFHSLLFAGNSLGHDFLVFAEIQATSWLKSSWNRL